MTGLRGALCLCAALAVASVACAAAAAEHQSAARASIRKDVSAAVSRILERTMRQNIRRAFAELDQATATGHHFNLNAAANRAPQIKRKPKSRRGRRKSQPDRKALFQDPFKELERQRTKEKENAEVANKETPKVTPKPKVTTTTWRPLDHPWKARWPRNRKRRSLISDVLEPKQDKGVEPIISNQTPKIYWRFTTTTPILHLASEPLANHAAVALSDTKKGSEKVLSGMHDWMIQKFGRIQKASDQPSTSTQKPGDAIMETTTQDRSIITAPLKTCPEGQKMSPDRVCVATYPDPEGSD